MVVGVEVVVDVDVVVLYGALVGNVDGGVWPRFAATMLVTMLTTVVIGLLMSNSCDCLLAFEFDVDVDGWQLSGRSDW